ncbi:MAG TPA: hypothetical protein PKD85_22305 [Saprospiraceae bacterium]|nr:hypothetical protein [Saprospiraceae bacterium]
MNDLKNEELLLKYIDNQCNEAERSFVESLLNSDPDLNALFVQMNTTNQLFKNMKADELPKNLQIKLEKQLQSQLSQIDFAPVTILPNYLKILLFVLTAILVVMTIIFPSSFVTSESFIDINVSDVVFYNIIGITGGIIFLLSLDKYQQNHKKTGPKTNLFMI